MFCNRFSDSAGPAGAGFMVGFEVGDEETFEFDLVVHGFDGVDKGFGGMGVVFEGADGFVGGAGVDAVLIVFLGKFGFVVLACLFVGGEGFDEAGSAFVSEPVTDDDVADAEGLGEVVSAGFWEGVSEFGVFEVEVALGVPVLFGEGWAVSKVGMAF